MYSLKFTPTAQKAYAKLDNSQRVQVAKALAARLRNPHITSGRLSGNLHGTFRIKLRAIGLRIVYEVHDDAMVVLVLAIGKRENNDVYDDLE